jgi:hypothetical protein
MDGELMRNLMIVMMVLSISLNSCFAHIGNAYTYSKTFDSIALFYEALEKDNEIIILRLELNAGESQVYLATIQYHTDTDVIYEYDYITEHKGLTYRNYVQINREESRTSGGTLFRGGIIDEEIIHEDLIIRTHLMPASKYNGPLTFRINFYFKSNGIGYYGEIVHVNEISENFDKQVFIDYIIELYETNKTIY